MNQNLKLIFVPYAGGSSMVFSSWKNYLNDSIDICPIEIAGRGRKLKTPFHHSVHQAALEIFGEIEDFVSDGNYAMVGHSMGSLLLYEVIHLIKEQGHPEPLHLFLSGRNPPHFHKDEVLISSKTDEAFIDEIKKIGGTPEAFFQNKDLMDVFLPILRADYEMVDQYRYRPYANKINCGITFFFAPDDAALSLEKVMTWADYTNGMFKIIDYPGGHFFLFDKAKEICKTINTSLLLAQQVSV